jgi:NADH-quinone oxidoreductase subunit H
MTVLAGIDWVTWILVIARVVVIFAALLVAVMLVIWIERKVVADMQVRVGPNRAGPVGLLITLADGIKLFFKEGVTPVTADRIVYLIAPIASMVPAILAFAVIPIGPGVTLFGRHVPFQVSDLNVGILWILAMGSLAVYGVVLAGWSSGSNYPLLGSIRSSAQMISYEVGMSLGLVAVVLYSGTLSMNEIVEVQARHFGVTGLGWLPKWNLFLQFPAFLIYMVAALAETNRPPFDLPEAETELVAGYHTEYSGIKFALFFLAEYTHTITVSAVGVTVFLGGWHGPQFDVVTWLWPVVWFLVKLFAVVYVLVWVRATVPRFRYDRLMAFGWKVLIPIGLLWIMVTAAIIALPVYWEGTTFGPFGGDVRAAVVIAAGTFAVLAVLLPLFVGQPRGIDRQREAARDGGNGERGRA